MSNIIICLTGMLLIIIGESLLQYEADNPNGADGFGLSFAVVFVIFGFAISIMALILWE